MRGVIPAGICMGLFATGLGSQVRGPAEPHNRRLGPQHLTVELVRTISMSEAELETVRDQLMRIWRQEDVIVETTTSWPPGLRLVLTEAPIRAFSATSSLCDLGVTRFINGTPEPELTVSVTAAREFVRQARPEWSSAVQSLIAARIVGRVAAHEMGHYLLAERGHRPYGLMRARFDGASLLAPHLEPFQPPPRIELDAGLSRAMRSARP